MYKDKSVLITGGTGLVGRHLIPLLLKEGAKVRVFVHNSSPEGLGDVQVFKGDLLNWENCLAATSDVDFVFHLALARHNVAGSPPGSSGAGIEFNTNLIMNTRIMEASRISGVERFLLTSAEAVYPSGLTICRENDAWTAMPDSAKKYYAWVKLIAEIQARAYAEEYGYDKIGIVRVATIYGPFDNFSTQGGPIIPSFIQRALAREDPFVIWGSGEQVRDFIHAKDVATGMMRVLEEYANCDPVNVGTGIGVRIMDLARCITEEVGYEPAIVPDRSKPEGLSRILDVKKAKEKANFEAKIQFREGIKETIKWYLNSGLAAKDSPDTLA